MENTPRSKVRQETPSKTEDENKEETKCESQVVMVMMPVVAPTPDVQIVKTLQGLPADLLSRDRDIQNFMGISVETFGIWVEAAEGLNLAIGVRIGTKEGWSLTGDIHELFRRRPDLSVRPSALRKKRLAERKPKK